MVNDYHEIIRNGKVMSELFRTHNMNSYADYIDDLLRVIKTQDKNQRGLIKLVLDYRRTNKKYANLLERMYRILNRGQQNVVDHWFVEEKYQN